MVTVRGYLCIFSLYLFGFYSLNAQISEGPNSAGTFANTTFTGSSASWTNLTNASSSDDIYVDIPLNSLSTNGAYTDNFEATNFGFSIPSGATINGIEVEIERSDINNAKDNYIGIIKGGTVGSEDKSLNPAWSSEEYIVYGSSTDLWSETWTPADLNSSDFGISISVKKQGGGANPQPIIDHIRITVHYTSAALPIQLAKFNVTNDKCNARISWNTYSEVNNDFFTIERTSNLKDWEVVDTIKGAGNSRDYQSYSIIDDQPIQEISYYRLKQTDFDGQYEYFDPTKFNNSESCINRFKIYPNPSNGTLSITHNNFSWESLEIFNGKGISVKKKVSIIENNTESKTIKVDVSNLVEGFYLIRVNDKEELLIKL